MEQNRSTKVVAIIALLVGVLGLSVGFSAYSKVLNIQNVQATVTGASSNFNVQFSTASDAASTGSVKGSASSATGGSATLADTTISNLTAGFTGAGNVTYSFFVRNEGKIPAYLTSVTFGQKNCAGTNGADSTLVTTACNDIVVKVSVGGKEYSATTASITDSTALAAGGNTPVIVTITNSGAHMVDGDFTATIPTITLNYSSQKSA